MLKGLLFFIFQVDKCYLLGVNRAQSYLKYDYIFTAIIL